MSHKNHAHLAGIILEVEYVKGQPKAYRPGNRDPVGTWKAWIQWNGNEATKDFVEFEYLIKLM